MSKGGKGDTELVKRPFTEAGKSDMQLAKRAATTKTASGFFAQFYDSHAKEMNPWQHIDKQSFNLKLSQEHKVGINISTPAYGTATEHVTIVPYGPTEIKCTSRDGCGGMMDKGQALDWACNALLRVECVLSPVVTFRADVMIVCINIEDGIDIEQAVRDIFNVVGDTDQPCWLLASIEDNWRHTWMQATGECTAAYKLLKHNAKETQEKLQAELNDTKEQLEKHAAVIDAIEELAKCSMCKTLVSSKAPCQLARCGHWVCAKCLHDYFHGLASFTKPFCVVCKDEVPRLTWQPFYALTGVSEAIQKLKPQEEVEKCTAEETAYLLRPNSPNY